MEEKSLIIPLYKKGDSNDINNYRGISLVNSIDKLIATLLLNRLKAWLSDKQILVENQAGFRKSYSTIDNIFNLFSIIKYLWYQGNESVYCYFIDFKAAFDKISRSYLFYKLYNIGISSKFLNQIEVLYSKTDNAVFSNNEISDSFESTSGVKQGCVLSPLLFSLFINDLVNEIGGGVTIRELKINMLLYADDIVFIAKDISILQLMINRLQRYCNTWGLVINQSKSQIMVFKKNGAKLRKNERWTFENKQIEIVKSYKYLGINLSSNLNLENHLKERGQIANFKLNQLWSSFITNKNFHFESKVNLVNAVSRSTICNGCQYWGFARYNIIERFGRSIIKRILKLPKYTPNYVLRVELGCTEWYLFTLKCHMHYILKIIYQQENYRFTNFLAKIFIQLKFDWFVNWIDIGKQCGVTWDVIDETLWKNNIEKVLNFIKEEHLSACLKKARETQSHAFFNKLSYMNGNGFLRLNFNDHFKSLILKVRCGLINLNDVPWRSENRKRCSLCVDASIESLYHFLGQCKFFKIVRFIFFKKYELSESEVLEILDGKDWISLYKFVSICLRSRQNMIAHFNF